MATAIEFNHVSKQYRLGLVSTRTLSHDLDRWFQTSILRREDPYLKIGEVNDRASKGSSEYVWALRDIDFKVEQGDVVGIIGKNGAGKSTLLKLLSKVTAPTTGTIRARGRIASLLEVGTGFHGEMTGRENIYMNGAILGMTKQEITSKLDEIVAFSGCERYLDTPVKRYSSGMMVRLGFAVAAHLDPEILVVDEVLAVGDAEFQKKAIGKMQDISHGEGRTVLFVSHNMASVRALCHHGVLLENGKVAYLGDIGDTIAHYQVSCVDKPAKASGWIHHCEHQRAELVSFELLNENNERVTEVLAGTTLKLRFGILNHLASAISHLKEVTFGIDDVYGFPCLLLNDVNVGHKTVLRPGLNEFEITIPKFPLVTGAYKVGFYMSDENGVLDHIDVIQNLMVDATSFYSTGKIHHKSKYLVDYNFCVV